MSWFRPVGYVSLLFAGLLSIYLFAKRYGGDDTTASATSSAAEEIPDELTETAPDAVRTNAAVAKQHVERQHCLAGCTSEVKICTATADGADAMKRCDERKQACEDDCP